MGEAIVLYTLSARGHLISTIELAKLILAYQPSLSIHILIMYESYTTPQSIASYIAKVANTIPSIYFHNLPSTNDQETQIFEFIRTSNPHFLRILLSIAKNRTINALIVDFFCVASLSVASQLNIPVYFFYTSSAGSLALTLQLPIIHQNISAKSLKDVNSFLDFPGLPPMLPSDLPKPVIDGCGEVYEGFLYIGINLPKSVGIITNTFELLEAKAIKAISDGLCVPNSTTPPIYCVGPLIATYNQADGGQPECLTWLDSQPSQSVVFLCFGSLGLFSKEQLREIANGLERSGQRFLWVVRNPPSNNQNLTISPQSDPDLESLLPDGFLDRTKKRGLVVKSWAPQIAVLNHKSVGGFVTHCGWNSVLESACAGVPMVAWPLYAEQRVNRVLLVKEMKIALPIIESENGFVTAMEVEKRVSELMDSELSKSVREQTIAMKNAANAALREDGPSRVTLSRIIESWIKHA